MENKSEIQGMVEETDLTLNILLAGHNYGK